jgi:hypothetical protein
VKSRLASKEARVRSQELRRRSKLGRGRSKLGLPGAMLEEALRGSGSWSKGAFMTGVVGVFEVSVKWPFMLV